MSRILITPLLLFYSPFGLFLVIIRSLLLIYIFLASVILYSVPPVKRIILRAMCTILGYFVTYEGNFKGSPDQPIVSNCVTLFDHMGINLLVNCVTPYKMMMSWALSWRHLNCDEISQKSKIKETFHLQPEEIPMGTSVNSLIKFNEMPFKLFNSVQPVTISVKNLLPIHLSIHPIDWRSEIFWLLFSPCVQMHVKFLEPIMRGDDGTKRESDKDYAERVRQAISEALTYKLSELDKNNLHKMTGEETIIPVDSPIKKDIRMTTNESVITESNCPGLNQVLAVLPEASKQKIKTLLDEYNGDVESVITVLLEEPSNSEPQTAKNNLTTPSRITATTSQQEITIAPSCYKIASANFSRNPTERHLSFEERKRIFMENARQRYLQIHSK